MSNSSSFAVEAHDLVKVFPRDSVLQADDLLSRVGHQIPLDAAVPNPAIVTTSADHWLVSINQQAQEEMGTNLVNLQESRSIAHTWVGIVTYKDMAECLGWPGKEIGFADIIPVRGRGEPGSPAPLSRARGMGWGRGTPFRRTAWPGRPAEPRAVSAAAGCRAVPAA